MTVDLATIQTYVSNVAGTQVQISCEADATFSQPGDDGFVLYGADGSILHVAHIRQSICTDAQNVDRKRARFNVSYFTFAGQRIDDVSGPALEVILHESMHIGLQSGDESVVECTAVENRWALVRQFKTAAWIANAVMAGMSWRHNQFPDQYRTVC